MKHKHAELIKKWADGAKIQIKYFENDDWKDVNPSWGEQFEYRIKPEEKHMKSEQIKHSLSVGVKSIQSRVFDRETDEVISFVKIPIADSGLVRCECIELTDEEIHRLADKHLQTKNHDGALIVLGLEDFAKALMEKMRNEQ